MNRNSHVLSRHGVNRPSPQVEIPVLQGPNMCRKRRGAHKHVITYKLRNGETGRHAAIFCFTFNILSFMVAN